ncbi:MAG: carbon storage regulator, partial [Bryobacteraceae bacterium]
MLVIRRRAGERFLIGDNVEVEVLEVGATQVKLGIRAPREITVLRSEIQMAVERNQAASLGVAKQVLTSLAKRLTAGYPLAETADRPDKAPDR